MNMYRYVHSDPVNWIDPAGTKSEFVCTTADCSQGYWTDDGQGQDDCCINVMADVRNLQPGDFARVGSVNRDPRETASGEGSEPQSPCSAGSHQTGTDANGKPVCAKDDARSPPEGRVGADLCAFFAGSGGAGLALEGVGTLIELAKGASLLDLVLAGGATAASSEVLVAVVAVGGANVLVDRATGGKITHFLGCQ
jgi:hypothetical protein